MGRKSQDGIYLPAGRDVYYCRFKDANGKRARISTGEKDEKRALQVCLNMMNRANSGELTLESESITIAQVFDLYFNGHGNKSRGKGYLYAKNNILNYFKTIKWRELSNNNGLKVRQYIEHRSKKVKPDTINKELGLISAAANYVKNIEGIHIQNPIPGKKQRVQKFQYQWLTPEQATTLIDKSKEIIKAPYLKDFIVISLNTGMRSGEILHLKKSQIDFEKRVISIPNNKSDRPHEVYMSDDVVIAIRNRIFVIKKDSIKTQWLFCHPNGERIQSVRRGFKSACKLAGITVTDRKKGIQGFRIHDQRHTTASWLVSEGVPLANVQELLNHEDIKTTQRYAHLAPENRIKTIKSLPKLTKSKASKK